MKNTRQPLILAVSLAAVLALSACGKKDESASQVPTAAPPATEPMSPAPSSTAALMPPSDNAAMAVSFGSVELGSTVDAGNKIAASGTTFDAKDSIYASVETRGTGTATLAAKWSYQDGQVVNQESKTINASANETTAFMINKPSGLPAGNYKVEISLDGNQVASKDFSVK